MNEEDLSSDLSDEDYVPEGTDAVLPSEEESDGEPEEDVGTEENTGKKRGKGKTKRKSKKLKVIEEPEPEEEKPTDETPLTEAEEKKKADSLWADFLKDTDTKPKLVDKQTEKVMKVEQKPPPPKKQEKTVSVTKIFEFAGEEVRVTKEVPADSLEARVTTLPPARGRGRGRSSGGAGLSSVLNQLGKKEKISTLEKTKLDWDRFKKAENIEEELQSHNKGKDGYLERQDFLQRADLRQFELEKDFRTKQRSHRL